MIYQIQYKHAGHVGVVTFHYGGDDIIDSAIRALQGTLPAAEVISVTTRGGERVPVTLQQPGWRALSVDALSIGETLKQALKSAGLLTVGDIVDFGDLVPLKHIGPVFARRIMSAVDEACGG